MKLINFSFLKFKQNIKNVGHKSQKRVNNVEINWIVYFKKDCPQKNLIDRYHPPS